MRQRKNFLAVSAAVAMICFAGSQLGVCAEGAKSAEGTKNPQSINPVTFAPPVNYTVGTLPFADAVADFNGDGILDIAICNESSNNISILFGNGDGTFQAAVNYAVGSSPSAIMAGDLNGDGIPDVAVADEIGKTIAVLINKADGTGTFYPAVLYPAGQAPRGITSGDTRNIGIQDLIVANNLGGDVTVFLGNGNGTFQAGVNYAADVNPKSVAVGKFNKSSNNLDIAVANHNTNDVSVLIGNGDGTFQAPVDYAVGIDPRHVLVADFNQDGNLDMAVANGGESTVSILYGNGDGTFQPQVKYTVQTSPRWLAIADYNNDGFLDIATSNYDAASVSVILGTGSSTAGSEFTAAQNFKVGANPTGLAAGVFTNNGLPDLAVTIGGLPTAANTITSILLDVPVSFSPAKLAFPLQSLGTTSAAQTVTMTNIAPNSLSISSITTGGSDPGDFAQTNNCSTALAGNSSCTINVTFTPLGINNRTASLVVADNAPGGSQTVALSGVSTAAFFSPSSLTFAAQQVGTSSPSQVITLTNESGTTMTISSLTIAGTNTTDFSQTNTCGSSLAGKKSCSITVTFTPTATGTRSATVSVADNGGGTPQTVPLTGTGTAPVTVSPTSLTYALQVLGTTSAAQTVTLSNGTTSAITISSIAIGGADPGDFSQTNNCGASLAASSSCTISVTFKPTNINHRAATLTITTSAGTFTVTLAGTSTAASFSPTSLTFAAQTVGTSSTPQNITLTDASGGEAITINSIVLTGTNPTDFSQTNNCGTSVAPKKSCTIVVTFTPATTGTLSANVSVTDNAGLSPQTVPLTGTGQTTTK